MRRNWLIILALVSVVLLGCSKKKNGGGDGDGDGDGDIEIDAGVTDAGDVACEGAETPENTDDACGDGCSNDGDAWVDCEDNECMGKGPCPLRDGGIEQCEGTPVERENTLEMCSDECSNDGDPYADCNDFDCCTVRDDCPNTTSCGRVENTAELCADGVSNDNDDYADCEDSDCCELVECGEDTYCGPIQAARCDGAPVDENTVELCSDGCSNDSDDKIDCEERDCCGLVECGEGTYCGDLAASQCPGDPVERENTIEMCNDGCSNDGDSYVDCEDGDCCDLVTCMAGTFCGDRM